MKKQNNQKKTQKKGEKVFVFNCNSIQKRNLIIKLMNQFLCHQVRQTRGQVLIDLFNRMNNTKYTLKNIDIKDKSRKGKKDLCYRIAIPQEEDKKSFKLFSLNTDTGGYYVVLTKKTGSIFEMFKQDKKPAVAKKLLYKAMKADRKFQAFLDRSMLRQDVFEIMGEQVKELYKLDQ